MKSQAMIALAVAASCGLLVYSFKSAGPEPTPSKVAHEKEKPIAAAASGPGAPLPQPSVTAVPSPALSEASTQPEAGMTADGAAKQKVLEEIHLASISYDAAELPRMQPYLLHGDPEIREAALNGFVVLGDAKGAPLLRNAARSLTDPKEAVKYLEKADWLELPSIPPEIIRTRLLKKKARAVGAPGANATPAPK